MSYIYIYISHTEPIEGHTTIFDAYVPVPSHTHMDAWEGRWMVPAILESFPVAGSFLPAPPTWPDDEEFMI